MKTALITGVTGQDGSYLAELLLEKGYKVIGVKRRTSLITTDRVDHLFDYENFELVYGNLIDGGNIHRLLLEHKPDEIYNLGHNLMSESLSKHQKRHQKSWPWEH